MYDYIIVGGGSAGSVMAQPFKTPIPADQYAAKPDPRGKHPAFTDATAGPRATSSRDSP